MRCGRRTQRMERSLIALQAERRRLIIQAVRAGLSEREAAALARCAPSYVHRLVAQ